MPTDRAHFFGLSQLLDSFMAHEDAGGSAVFSAEGFSVRQFPPVQVTESPESVCIQALVPGAALSDICLEMAGGSLIMRGKITPPQGRHLIHERPTGVFARNIPLPAAVKADTAKALLRNGVLTITIGKAGYTTRRAIKVTAEERS